MSIPRPLNLLNERYLNALVVFLEDNGANIDLIVDELLIDDEKYDDIISMGKEVLTPK